MAINVKDIPKIMDLTWKVWTAGKRTIPAFSGPSGIGKSQGVHQWVKSMQKKFPGFSMIDLRGATIDASDTRGLPWKDDKTGTTVFLPPDFLPKQGTFGVLFIDEINRSSTPVQNCFMELFTEKRIGNYYLPSDPEKGLWIIVTAFNPADSDAYDVNSMDAALLNRILKYDVKFDHKSFLSYARSAGWSDSVINFLASGEWVYKEPGQGDGFYIAPRTWEEVSDLELANAKEDADLHNDICMAALGKNIGGSYWNYCHKTRPITYDDLLKDFDKVKKDKKLINDMPSMKELMKQADTKKGGTSYRADLISSTVQSFITAAAKGADKIDFAILDAVCMALPADQTAMLVQAIAMKTSDPARWIADFKRDHKELFARLKTGITKEGVKTAGQ